MRWSLALVVGLLAVPAAFAQPLPLFDAHIHYSQPAWDVYPPESLPEILNRVRAWLRQLPRDVAERIGSLNAERLFGPP